jgi:hypothetical protein
MSDVQHPADQADERPLQQSQAAIDEAKAYAAEHLEVERDEQAGDESGLPVSGGGAAPDEPAPAA